MLAFEGEIDDVAHGQLALIARERGLALALQVNGIAIFVDMLQEINERYRR
jgi:hypothetical protein